MTQFKLWVDDVRKPPDDTWKWTHSVNEAKKFINLYINERVSDQYTSLSGELLYRINYDSIIIDLDHDAGDYASDGGDYIKLLDWLEYIGYVDDSFSFHIHSMNPVGVQNMRAIIDHNGWKYI